MTSLHAESEAYGVSCAETVSSDLPCVPWVLTLAPVTVAPCLGCGLGCFPQGLLPLML